MLEAGVQAPDFTLPGESGDVSLSELTTHGPTLLAFFKTTCSTCRLAFPVYSRLVDRHQSTLPIVAIAQDPLDRARAFLDDAGWTGPVLDDASGDYAVSAAYELPSVPTLYLIGPDGRIELATTGWSRHETNDWDQVLARQSGAEPAVLSPDDDGLPDFKPG